MKQSKRKRRDATCSLLQVVCSQPFRDSTARLNISSILQRFEATEAPIGGCEKDFL